MRDHATDTPTDPGASAEAVSGEVLPPDPPAPPRRVPFVVYQPETGQILRAGTCSETDIDLQPNLGEAVLEGEASDDTHYTLDDQITELPPSPGDWAEFDFAARAWVDPRSPAEVEAEARAPAIAQARAYLTETDWYVTRQAETGTPIPDDIAAARAKARAVASS
ncbi:hypothetical protein [Gemmobacter serpentinus]|uniref:hypothetical protein n=1 Tax=Gemmobacter serpentinus TaxID=2652247 RepID=UPI00124EAE7E|nr:hypothetical protein [Gemmobacter serpentinus]